MADIVVRLTFLVSASATVCILFLAFAKWGQVFVLSLHLSQLLAERWQPVHLVGCLRRILLGRNDLTLQVGSDFDSDPVLWIPEFYTLLFHADELSIDLFRIFLLIPWLRNDELIYDDCQHKTREPSDRQNHPQKRRLSSKIRYTGPG
ncbi:MAG: hypothetical protein IPO69_00585 [Saprospiraceae bacterium]|nr:hypothetical protein [Saprospiraceae bacterium]